MNLNDRILDDIDVFVDTETGFAVDAIIGDSTVSGVFDAAYAERLNTAGTAPVFLCRSADVAAVEQGDPVTIDGVEYEVAGIEPDGTGMTTLVLEDVS